MTTIADPRAPHSPVRRSGPNLEKWGWIYMRASGVLLVILIFGHLFVNLMTGTGIHHEEHHIGLFDCQQRLLRHPGFHALFRTINTTGIDTDEFAAFDFGPTTTTFGSDENRRRATRRTSSRPTA